MIIEGCGTDQTRRLAVGDDVVHEDSEMSVMGPQSSQALERPVVFQLALSVQQHTLLQRLNYLTPITIFS